MLWRLTSAYRGCSPIEGRGMRLSQSQNSQWPRTSHWRVITSSPLWLGMDCRGWPRGERLHLPTSASLISLQGKGPWRHAPIHHVDSFGQSAHYITGFNKKLLEAAVLVIDAQHTSQCLWNPSKVKWYLGGRGRKKRKNGEETTLKHPLKVNLRNKDKLCSGCLQSEKPNTEDKWQRNIQQIKWSETPWTLSPNFKKSWNLDYMWDA